jgi:hypothetical protein
VRARGSDALDGREWLKVYVLAIWRRATHRSCKSLQLARQGQKSGGRSEWVVNEDHDTLLMCLFDSRLMISAWKREGEEGAAALRGRNDGRWLACLALPQNQA